MIEFISNNWLAILSILIGLVVSYVFYRLQKRDVVSAKEERLKRAREELLDTIESVIINKQQLTEEGIFNLLAASERVHQVDLNPGCTPTSLLQDVALRLHRSRHLDVGQKTDYSAGIETLIRSISQSHTVASPAFGRSLEITSDIETSLQAGKTDEALEQLHALKLELSKPRVVPAAEDDHMSKIQFVLSLVAGLMAGLTSLLSLRDFDMFSKLTDTAAAALVGAAVVAGIATIVFIIRRSMGSQS